MTGNLRIANDLIIFKHELVTMALEWLIREHNCTIDGVMHMGDVTMYTITGREIPQGDIALQMEEVVPGVMSITII